MIYSDHDIKRAVRDDDIRIEPFDPAAVQPASVDVRLGRVFWRFRKRGLKPVCPVIDPTEDVKRLMFRQDAPELEIQSHELVLGVTLEKVTLCDFVVARVEGKSSLGRLGLSVHVTAGFIDPGFSGHVTLEMYNCAPFPIRLRAGMWIGQLAFTETKTACDVPYGKERGSRYTDQDACEPVPSRVHVNLG